MFALSDKAKPDIENIRGLNLVGDQAYDFQVAKLPL
jgi:hypothetical protein